MKVLLVGFLLCLSFGSWASWEDYFDPIGLGFPQVNDLELPWKPSGYAQNAKAPHPANLEVRELHCHSSVLWPVHPLQTTKDYVYAVTASYKTETLSPAHAIVMSDFFQDECGEVYKAYWVVAFLANEETMTTLVSKGRSIQRRPGGHPGEFVAGSTSNVSLNEFMFLTTLEEQDRHKIDHSQKRAYQDGFILNGLQWIKLDR